MELFTAAFKTETLKRMCSPLHSISFASYKFRTALAFSKVHCDDKHTKVYGMHYRLLEFNAS